MIFFPLVCHMNVQDLVIRKVQDCKIFLYLRKNGSYCLNKSFFLLMNVQGLTVSSLIVCNIYALRVYIKSSIALCSHRDGFIRSINYVMEFIRGNW